MKNALFLTLGLILLVGLGLILFPPATPNPTTGADLPWQIEQHPDGQVRVLGLTPGVSTLADIRHRFGDGISLAVVAAPGETGSLEGYYESLTLGPLSAKLIVTFDVPRETIDTLRQRAPKSQYMESATRRYHISAEDKAALAQAPIAVLGLIPAVQLDAATLQQRFGPPAERIPSSETSEHWLYPTLGLDILLDQKGKELLQYVAPAQFSRLRSPLTQPTSTPSRPNQ